MPNLLITYDLPSGNYAAVENALKSLGPWAKVGTTTFVVWTYVSAIAARDFIGAATGPFDKLFVCDSGPGWASKGEPSDVVSWLHLYWP